MLPDTAIVAIAARPTRRNPWMRDEDDLDRFAGEIGYCPDCGAEIWDEAWQCPHCHAVVEGRVARDRPDPVGSSVARRSVIALVVIIVIVLVIIQLG